MSFFISPSLDASAQYDQILAHHPVRQLLQLIDGNVEHAQLDYSASTDETHQVLADIHSLQLSQRIQLCRRLIDPYWDRPRGEDVDVTNSQKHSMATVESAGRLLARSSTRRAT